jgi:hypothetical protein
VASAAVALWPREKEPEYEGITLSEWLKVMSRRTYNPSTGTGEWAHADWAVEHIGSNAVPFLVRWIGYERPGWSRKAWVQTIFAKFPRLERSCTRRWDEREALALMSVAGFKSLGPYARDAIPGLVRLVKAGGPKPRMRAMTTLEQLGQEGLSPLVEVSNEDSAPGRFEAAAHLLSMGRAGVDIDRAVPTVLRRGAEIRSNPRADPKFPPGATWSTPPFYVEQMPFASLSAVVGCVSHSNSAVRSEAIILLMSWAWYSDPVVSALGGALKDPDLDVRQAATNALRTAADDLNSVQMHKARALLGMPGDS